jgi:hypothetical protein
MSDKKSAKNIGKITMTIPFDLSNPDEKRLFAVCTSLKPGLLAEKLKPHVLKAVKALRSELDGVTASADPSLEEA